MLNERALEQITRVRKEINAINTLEHELKQIEQPPEPKPEPEQQTYYQRNESYNPDDDGDIPF